MPRLLIAWMATEAVRTRSKTLHLGRSMAAFMNEINVSVGGGKRGGSTALKKQLERVCASSFNHCWGSEAFERGRVSNFVSDYVLWWDPKEPEQETLWSSAIQLSDQFYEELLERAVPIDQRAIQALRRSPLELDILVWATHRTRSLKSQTLVRWEALRLQFGAGYARMHDFREAFKTALQRVNHVYPTLRFLPEEKGLLLRPSPPQIRSRNSG
jgi:hypothetical protein